MCFLTFQNFPQKKEKKKKNLVRELMQLVLKKFFFLKENLKYY